MLAPKRTARMNGSDGTPSWLAMLTAIGVPMAAAALFETMLVMTVMSSRNALRIRGGGSPDARPTKVCAM